MKILTIDLRTRRWLIFGGLLYKDWWGLLLFSMLVGLTCLTKVIVRMISGYKSSLMFSSRIVTLVVSMIILPICCENLFCFLEYSAKSLNIILTLDSYFLTQLLCSSEPLSDWSCSVYCDSLVRVLASLSNSLRHWNQSFFYIPVKVSVYCV